MRPYQNRPFPPAFYTSSVIRKNHYFVWWTLCNEVDADPDGWIRITREELERVFMRTQKMKSVTLTAILKTLEIYDFLTLLAHAPYRTYQVERYEILISPDAWAERELPKAARAGIDRKARRILKADVQTPATDWDESDDDFLDEDESV